MECFRSRRYEFGEFWEKLRARMVDVVGWKE